MRLLLIIGLFLLTEVPAWATEETDQKKTFAEQTAVTKEDVDKLKTQITDYQPQNK